MINYSIVMRSVNANLFEINQAKSRINQAKANGETPTDEDLALVATEKQNAYAIAQYADVMTIEKFARHIASHGCVYSRADIAAILYLAVDCMREQLLDGKKIRLGDLGDFSVSLQSKGAPTADKFSSQYITGVTVNWDCGQEFKNLIHEAEFNLVASRSAQAAVIKAIKEGKEVVDLSKPVVNDDDNPDGGGDTPTKPKYLIKVVTPNADYGTVEGGGEYEEGETVNLLAEPKSGYKFVSWDDGNTSASRFVQVTEAKTYTATFAVKTSTGEDDDFTPPQV